MTARHELFESYAEWRRWTESEGEAISASNWPRVRACQDAKAALQTRIIRTTQRAREECSRGGGSDLEMNQAIRTVIGDLIRLEMRNGEVLALRRQAAESQRAELDRSSQNLRRVQHSYGGAREGAWTSFS